MSAFIVCWLPFFVLALVRPFNTPSPIPPWVSSLFLWLGYANSLLNPIIYATLNKDFRKPFQYPVK
ncbi:5-hydroxytryptamine receptor 1 [Portunus trituberculatus]|uniref:5-hydroxytryptamine receptor 1 n=1 Tax=Portunus trituberculatus TaxID=210409 RepID=A0A5B7HQM0_PORTR|nr:5-hydroxytryptamine receptor 1 [Portunus trituberculatus]